MNNIYLYDGSFYSLLALISNLIIDKVIPSDIKSEDEYIPNLLDTPVYLKLEDIKNKIYFLKKHISLKVMHRAYYVFLSIDERKEIIIYYFLKNALIYQDEILYRRDLNCVNHTLKISSRVSLEAHKLKGFLRFKEMKNNFFYASIAPTNNVIEILANHFRKRLSSEYWMIKDVKRNIYAFYNLKEVIFLTSDDIKELNLEISSDEESFEDLWKTFFETIAIKERENLKTQMNFMPKKYWQYMLEMEDKL